MNGGIPKFDDKVQGKKFLDWINFVEELFEYFDTSDRRKVRLVTIKFRKYASHWWKNLNKSREMNKEAKLLFRIRLKKS